MSNRIILGLTGPIGSGKTTAANMLFEMGFTRVRFAGPLKAMLRSLGLTEPEIDGNLKEVPCTLLGGKTPRFAMQTLGGEWGRDTINPDLWVKAWLRAVEKMPSYNPIVADDVRYENEMQAIWRLGGRVAMIKRHGCAYGEHSSERFAFTPNVVVTNNGSLAEFQGAIRELANDMKGIMPEKLDGRS